MCQRRRSLLEISFCFLSTRYDRLGVCEMLCYVRLTSSWFDYAFYVIIVVHQMPHLSCATLTINVKDRKERRSQRKSDPSRARFFQYLSYVVWTTFDCLGWAGQISVDILNLSLNWLSFPFSCFFSFSSTIDRIHLIQLFSHVKQKHTEVVSHQYTRHNQVKIMTIIHPWIFCARCLRYLVRYELNLTTSEYLPCSWIGINHTSHIEMATRVTSSFTWDLWPVEATYFRWTTESIVIRFIEIDATLPSTIFECSRRVMLRKWQHARCEDAVLLPQELARVIDCQRTEENTIKLCAL